MQQLTYVLSESQLAQLSIQLSPAPGPGPANNNGDLRLALSYRPLGRLFVPFRPRNHPRALRSK